VRTTGSLRRFFRRPTSPAEPDDEAARRGRRKSYFLEAREMTPYLAVASGGHLYFVSTEDIGVGRVLFTNERRGDQEILRQASARLDALAVERPVAPVFVDVGANIGTTTIPALADYGFAAAVGIEASPENLRLLRVNLAANGMEDRVQVIGAAASDEPGQVEFDVTNTQRGDHRVWKPTPRQERKIAKGKPRVIDSVPAITLDALVEEGTIKTASTGMLWIDAPKHEANVLLGSSRLLEAGVPVVTAIRVANSRGDPERPWDVPPALKEEVLERLCRCYTDVVVLTWDTPLGEASPITDLPQIVDSFPGSKNILLVRRDCSDEARTGKRAVST
jgi:FkbM family methyltransferase